MDLNEIKERMRTGRLYFCDDPTLQAEQRAFSELLYDFNQTRPSELERRQELLSRLLAEAGEGCYVEPPLHANWGCHTHFGKNVYANFGLTLVDDCDIWIGDHVMFAPHVTVVAGTHPISPPLRRKTAQYNLPVEIGANVWIGAGSVILPGVHIGENTVIGAGSVVTKDIPANVVAVGVPCRVLREIGEEDLRFYEGNRPIDLE